jgi:hypothetical protein
MAHLQTRKMIFGRSKSARERSRNIAVSRALPRYRQYESVGRGRQASVTLLTCLNRRMRSLQLAGNLLRNGNGDLETLCMLDGCARRVFRRATRPFSLFVHRRIFPQPWLRRSPSRLTPTLTSARKPSPFKHVKLDQSRISRRNSRRKLVSSPAQQSKITH